MADSLLTDLVSWWPLDGPDGARADAHGENHLSDNNTVLSAAGLGHTAASFNAANSEHLSIPDRTDLQSGPRDITVSCWFRISDTLTWAPHPAIAAKQDGSGRDWQITVVGTVGPGGLSARFGSISGDWATGPAGGVVAGQWYHVVAWHDETAATNNMQINGGTVITKTGVASPVASTAPMAIGRSGGLAAGYFSGLIQDVAVWSRVLTSDERSRLYNAGAGLTYSDIAAPSGGINWPLIRRIAAMGDLRFSPSGTTF